MGKSLEFVKERIASGQCNGMENNKYESMIEQDIRELFTVVNYTKNGTILVDVPYLKGDKPYFNVIIKHDPDADFEYFTMQRCNCDGTFVFFQDLMGECIDKMIHLKTCNVNKEIPKDLTGYSIIYTVGDFVLAEEFGDEFATKEKPWMHSRFTAMLPIKFDVVRNGNNSMKKYKLTRSPNPETHASDEVIFIKDENGNELGAGFSNECDAFDYIKLQVENDKEYADYLNNPRKHIMDMYNLLDEFDKKMIEQSMVQKYRNECMYQYFR